MNGGKKTKQSADKRKTFIDKCIKDKTGKRSLAEKPNAPIIVWALARVVVWLSHGTLQEAARDVAFGTLFTWAWLELFQGTNYVRRALGFVVLAWLLVSAVHAGHLV